MTVIAHISDTHFGTEIPRVVEALREAIARIRPDIIVLSGDITQRARRAQFAAAAAFMKTLHPQTRIVIPGNHDIPLYNVAMRFLAPYRNYTRAFGQRESLWAGEQVVIVGYNATHALRHTHGKLSEAAVVASLASAREIAPSGALIIAAAHQPLDVAWPQDADEILIDGDRTATLFSQHGIDVVLSGHVHVPLLTTTRERYPMLARHVVLAGAGTAVSHRTRPGAPNSFNVLHVGTGLRIERWDFETAVGLFALHNAETFVRQSDGWAVVRVI